VEGAFVQAILNPGEVFEFRGLKFYNFEDVSYIELLSGRRLSYHRPRLEAGGKRGFSITYEGWNTNPKNGPTGWITMRTWGGRLTENINQATARDVFRFGMINLERSADYRIVQHVYDEFCAEVPEGFGDPAEMENIMMAMPPWAQGWPIRAAGGWRGRRYRK
jgi:DNA polymerase